MSQTTHIVHVIEVGVLLIYLVLIEPGLSQGYLSLARLSPYGVEGFGRTIQAEEQSGACKLDSLQQPASNL